MARTLLLAASFVASASAVASAQGLPGSPPLEEEGPLRYWTGLSLERSSAALGDLTFSGPGALNAVFGVPDALIGGAVHAFSGLTHEHGRFSRAGEADRSMMVRMSGALDVVSRDRPFDDFATLLGEREARYVARWQESPLATVEADTEFDPVDSGDYLRDQRKILVHALGRSYLGRYGESIDDGLRREAFDFSRWGAVDCVVGPALVGGYLFWRGWDGRMLVGDFDCRLNLLPLQRIESHLRKTDDLLLTAASLEIGVQGLPVRFILSGGLNDGHPEFDFIGIGTSLAVARKSLKLASDSQDPER